MDERYDRIYERIKAGSSEMIRKEDALESEVADLYLDYPIHAGGAFFLSKKFFEYCESKGVGFSDNQKRAIGYPLALAFGHTKEKYRDEIYRVDDILSYPMGVEAYIQWSIISSQESEDLGSEQNLEPGEDILERFRALGKTEE